MLSTACYWDGIYTQHHVRSIRTCQAERRVPREVSGRDLSHRYLPSAGDKVRGSYSLDAKASASVEGTL